MLVPELIRTCVDGEPVPGTTDAVLAFLTTDDDGFPHVCLLSRAQLAAGTDLIRAVIRAGNTTANLDRSGCACIVVVSGDAAHYLKLAVVRRTSHESLIGYALRIHHHKVDAVPGSALRPMTYAVTPDMPVLEDWDRTRQLLDGLA